jgi:hypothetical protein
MSKGEFTSEGWAASTSEADQVIDMTDPKGPVRSISVLTPAGIVRVNVDLVVVRTGQQCVTVDVEANDERRPLARDGGLWDVTTNHTPRGITARLTRREGS